jgi:IPT/TIG domain-containing protein
MARWITPLAVASLLITLGALGLAPAADAATKTSLVLSQSAAFAVLKYDCGNIQERVYATGFAANGYPAGAEHLQTTCSSGGRGGHSFTVTGWASSVWTWYGATRSYEKLEKEPAGLSTTFKAEDSHGDKIYNEGTSVYLETTNPPVKAPATPTNVMATAYRTGEEGQEGPQKFNVTWTPDPENRGLITSSTVTATPVGSTAPVLTATVNGSGNIAQLGTLELTTTYKIVVTNTDPEGTSQPSQPIQAKSLTKEEQILLAPAVGTSAATEVAQASARLNAAVNPRGEEVSACYFEYGVSEAYGESAPCSSLPGEGETSVGVSAPVAGLTPITTYHFRIVAASPGGTSYGSDETFTTTSTGPAPTVKKLSPKTGPKAGGTLVTISGTGFTGATAVKFGSTEVSFTFNSETSISVVSPAGTKGTVDVTVTTPDGTSAITSKDHFKYKK